MTPDTLNPPAPSPASAETLERFAEFIEGTGPREPFTLTQEFPATLRAGADALRRLQSTEQDAERYAMEANDLTLRLIAAEQRLRDLEQEQG